MMPINNPLDNLNHWEYDNNPIKNIKPITHVTHKPVGSQFEEHFNKKHSTKN